MSFAIVAADDSRRDGLSDLNLVEGKVRIIACIFQTNDSVSERTEVECHGIFRYADDLTGQNITLMDRL